MFTKRQKILLGIVSGVLYIGICVIYLLSYGGRIAFVPGGMNAIVLDDQAAGNAILVRKMVIRDKNGGYVIFRSRKPTESSQTFASNYFSPGVYTDVRIPMSLDDPITADVFVPGTEIKATLYNNEDRSQYNLPNWRFPLRDIFGVVVSDTFLLQQ